MSEGWDTMELVGKRKRGREIFADPSFKFIKITTESDCICYNLS